MRARAPHRNPLIILQRASALSALSVAQRPSLSSPRRRSYPLRGASRGPYSRGGAVRRNSASLIGQQPTWETRRAIENHARREAWFRVRNAIASPLYRVILLLAILYFWFPDIASWWMCAIANGPGYRYILYWIVRGEEGRNEMYLVHKIKYKKI